MTSGTGDQQADHDDGDQEGGRHGPGHGPGGVLRHGEAILREPLEHLPSWLRPGPGEHRLPAATAVLAIIALQLLLPHQLVPRPVWLLPAIELALLITLLIADPGRLDRESTVLRILGLSLVAVASLATAYSAAVLVFDIATNRAVESRGQLFVNGAAIWLTNVLVFALWYWEFDRGGPAARAHARRALPDFLFPQMNEPHYGGPDWAPEFIDYLYVSFTNATAFSPTDTMPLSRWAKLAMMFQAAVSFIVVLLVIARAVNLER